MLNCTSMITIPPFIPPCYDLEQKPTVETSFDIVVKERSEYPVIEPFCYLYGEDAAAALVGPFATTDDAQAHIVKTREIVPDSSTCWVIITVEQAYALIDDDDFDFMLMTATEDIKATTDAQERFLAAPEVTDQEIAEARRLDGIPFGSN